MAAIKTWNASALTGGVSRALDVFSTASLTDGDRAFVAVGGTLYYYEFDSTATNAESSPTYIRPDDYVSSGVWVLQRWYTQEDGYNPNLLINSDFAVNQEAYAESGAITTGSYGHDMWKSISSASYTTSDGALTMVSGTLGQRNDDLIAADGETVTMSVESGSVTIGATAGAAATTITSGSPYSWTLDMSSSAFITITAATSAKGIKIERGSAASKYQKPEPRAEEARCYWYYQKIGLEGSFSSVFRSSSFTFSLPLKAPIKSPPTTATFTEGSTTLAGSATYTPDSYAANTTNIENNLYMVSIIAVIIVTSPVPSEGDTAVIDFDSASVEVDNRY